MITLEKKKPVDRLERKGVDIFGISPRVENDWVVDVADRIRFGALRTCIVRCGLRLSECHFTFTHHQCETF